MSGRNLKHYDEYLQALELYAEASGLTVEYAREDSDGAWIPTRRKIRIDPDLSQSHEIAVFLHELGHSIDPSINTDKHGMRLEKAYAAVMNNKHRKSQLQLVLDCEERAWRNGRAIAKKLRIRLGKWYDEVVRFSLETYRKQ